MMKIPTYTQCELIKDTPKHAMYQVGWIPTEFAKKGKFLDLKIYGKWSKGWKVSKVMGTESAVYVEVHETDYKRQRKASDI